jgi:hypothetical protein
MTGISGLQEKDVLGCCLPHVGNEVALFSKFQNVTPQHSI